MNRKIKLIGGYVAVAIGVIYLVNAFFIGEANDYLDAVFTRITYLSLALSFIGLGYYFGIRNNTKNPKPALN